MRKRIDGHAHIKPASLVGLVQPRFGVVVRPFGRVEDESGEVLFRPMPEYMESGGFSAEALLQVLDRHGIEKAMVMAPLYLKNNEEMARFARQYPDRLRITMVLEPTADCLDEMAYWVGQGLWGMKFEMHPKLGFPGLYPDLDLASPLFMKIWAQAQQLGMPAVIDPNRIGGPGYQAEQLDRVATAFPELKMVICHLGYPGAWLERDAQAFARWRQMISLARHPNVWFDLAALTDLFAEEGYPYPRNMELVRLFAREYGADSLIWGSDVPGTYNNATYPQMMQLFERCDFFTERDKDMLFYQNAQTVYFDHGGN